MGAGVLGMTDVFSGMDLNLCSELGEKWKIHLLDENVSYKEEILCSLYKDYRNTDSIIEAGYTKDMLENAKSVLEKNGYFVNLDEGIVRKI